jgi:hypothetical protein
VLKVAQKICTIISHFIKDKLSVIPQKKEAFRPYHTKNPNEQNCPNIDTQKNPSISNRNRKNKNLSNSLESIFDFNLKIAFFRKKNEKRTFDLIVTGWRIDKKWVS